MSDGHGGACYREREARLDTVMGSNVASDPSDDTPSRPEPDALDRVLADPADTRRVDQAFDLVYRELKVIAHRALARHSGGTLGTTGLVHEAYARLAAHPSLSLAGRRHFFATCARAMRQIVIDHARRRQADKRGAGQALLSLDQHPGLDLSQPDNVVALDLAFAHLDAHAPRLAELLQLRLFAGLELEQIAPLVGVTVRQLQRDWQRARLWLYQALLPDQNGPP